MAALERAGADLSEGQPDRNPSHGLDPEGPEVGWVTVRGADIDQLVEVAARAGWALRSHWPTPACPVCVDGRANMPDGSGLGTCLHCAGKGFTNRAPKSREQQLEERVAALEARLGVAG